MTTEESFGEGTIAESGAPEQKNKFGIFLLWIFANALLILFLSWL
jgi:hypothetical protein